MTTDNQADADKALDGQQEELTIEQAKEQINHLKGIKSEAFKERDALKSKLKSFEDAQAEREQALLTEQGKFKELYEASQAKLQEIQSTLKTKAVDAAIRESLMKAGARAVETVAKIIDKNSIKVNDADYSVDADSITAQIEQLKKTDPILFAVGESNLPPVKRPSDGSPIAGFEQELRAAKSQQEVMAVMKKFGKI